MGGNPCFVLYILLGMICFGSEITQKIEYAELDYKLNPREDCTTLGRIYICRFSHLNTFDQSSKG